MFKKKIERYIKLKILDWTLNLLIKKRIITKREINQKEKIINSPKMIKVYFFTKVIKFAFLVLFKDNKKKISTKDFNSKKWKIRNKKN